MGQRAIIYPDVKVRKFNRAGLLSGIAVLSACAVGLSAQAAQDKVPSKGAEQHLSASDAKTALQLARATRSAGDLSAAIDLYRNIAEKNSDPAVQVEYGDVLLQNGLIDDAIGVYQAVNPTSKADVGAQLGLQQAYMRLSEPQKALEAAQRAASLGPADERALVGLGVAFDAVGRHQEAQGAYRRALVIAPRSVAARNDLALSLAMTGQFQEAVDLLTPIAKSSNASPRVRQNLAVIYGLMGDRTQALALSRVDLDATSSEANLRFLDYVRAHAAKARPGPSHP